MLAVPGETDYYLYAWIVQHGTGVSISLCYVQLSKLFPSYRGLVIAFSLGLAGISALIPELWNLVIETTDIELSMMFLIWIIIRKEFFYAIPKGPCGSLALKISVFQCKTIPTQFCISYTRIVDFSMAFTGEDQPRKISNSLSHYPIQSEPPE